MNLPFLLRFVFHLLQYFSIWTQCLDRIDSLCLRNKNLIQFILSSKDKAVANVADIDLDVGLVLLVELYISEYQLILNGFLIMFWWVRIFDLFVVRARVVNPFLNITHFATNFFVLFRLLNLSLEFYFLTFVCFESRL